MQDDDNLLTIFAIHCYNNKKDTEELYSTMKNVQEKIIMQNASSMERKN